MNPRAIYEGSDGEATKALYADLQKLGPDGELAVNLFRACKCSERAKKYRGGNSQGRYRDLAYQRKQYSLEQLSKILAAQAESLGIAWGWKIDPAQEYHRWVLYCELPTGQVSFHTDKRGIGPDFSGEWDGVREAAAGRIIAFVESVLPKASEEGV